MLAIESTEQLSGGVSAREKSWIEIARAGWRLVFFWRERARQRSMLAQLDSRMLNDIGITRAAAERECNKPFWR